MVSVDVKHHAYLLTYLRTTVPSLISLMVSVDVTKHHAYLRTTVPSLINHMVTVDVKHHAYLLTYGPPTVWLSRHGSSFYSELVVLDGHCPLVIDDVL